MARKSESFRVACADARATGATDTIAPIRLVDKLQEDAVTRTWPLGDVDVGQYHAMLRCYRGHPAVRRRAWWLVQSEAMDGASRVGERVPSSVLDVPIAVANGDPCPRSDEGFSFTTLRAAARDNGLLTVLIGSST